MSAPEAPAPAAREPEHGRLLVCLVAAGCLAVMAWMGLGWDVIASRETYTGRKTDYYSSLVHGFLLGHAYMDMAADPRLASSDPAVRGNVVGSLDTSYYRGRYYLYFGAVPAALVLLPYARLTGGDLDPRVVVVLCAAAGFLFSLGILRMAARDHWDRARGWYYLAAVPLLAFATGVPLMLTRAMFYELAVAGGYACSMGGLYWLYRALFRPHRRCLALALASASMALAVGCRPDLVLNMPVLAAAAVLLAVRDGGRAPGAPGFVRFACAAILPAAAIGACLAAYNFERFGSPTEFGMSYSQNYFIQGHLRLFSAAYLWPNIRWYYLTLPALSPYFPFAFPENAYFGPPDYRGGEAIHGQWVVLVLCLFVAVTAGALGWQKAFRRLGGYLALLGWMFLALFLATSALGVRADRYMVDFQAPLVLGVVLVCGFLAQATASLRFPRMWTGALFALTGAVVLFNFFAGLQQFEAFRYLRPSTYAAWERCCDYPSYWLAKAGLLPSGPVEVTVVFPSDPKVAAIEPLVTIGTPNYSDSVYTIEWAGGRTIEIEGDHHGYGGPLSAALPITPGRAYTFRVDMGALYPPPHHPFFDSYTARQARLMKTRIQVQMDGAVVLDKRMESWDAPPWSLEAGRNDISMTPFKESFTGDILGTRRLPAPKPEVIMANTGLWRISCVLPTGRMNWTYPILAAGPTGSGTLVYLNVLAGNRYSFGVDEWGFGGASSGIFTSAPKEEHIVEIFVGPQAAGAHWPAAWAVPQARLDRLRDTLRVWLDGKLLWSTPLRHPVGYADSQVFIGDNVQGFSSAPAIYDGPIQSEAYFDYESREFLERNLAAP